jgi:hypothetical protein
MAQGRVSAKRDAVVPQVIRESWPRQRKIARQSRNKVNGSVRKRKAKKSRKKYLWAQIRVFKVWYSP